MSCKDQIMYVCSLYSLDLYSEQLQARNFTQGWLNYNWLLPVFLGPFILHTSTYSLCIMFMFSPSRELYISRKLVFVHSHTCLSLMLVVVGSFRNCSMHLIVCICVLGIHKLLLRLLSLCLRSLSLLYSWS